MFRIEASQNIINKKNILMAKKVVVGFDGFVDEIIHVVDTRQDKTNYTRIETIEAFGKRILSAAGKSTNMELVPVLKKLGGNGPLMSMAAAGLGAKVTCIGLMGHPALIDVFEPLAKCCRIVSVGDPGHTDALEFSDGKVMFGKLNTIPQMCWENILEIMGEKEFARVITGADLVACTNWTMLTEIKEVFSKIISLIPYDFGTMFFFDLADPEKRPRAEIEEVLEQIKELNVKAPCVLGLNLREAEQISRVLGIKEKPRDGVEGLAASVKTISDKLGIFGTAIHSVGHASACVDGVTESVEGPFCPNPKITTGAGDHFNGGFSSGLLAGLPVKDSLYLGVGTSGWYVRNNGSSPTLEDVSNLLKDWSQGNLDR